MRSTQRRVASVAVSAVLGLVLGAVPARAAVITTRETSLVLLAGALTFDNPDVARTISVTESGNSIVLTIPGEPIASTDDARCPSATGSVTCDLTGIADLNVLTGNGDDHIDVTTRLPTVLCGGPGDDVITGGPQVDLLAGAAGDDVLSGGGGDDFLRADRQAAGSGTEPFCSAQPTDRPGNNRLDGGAGADLVVGDAGDDVLHGGADGDVVFGRPGDDEIHGDDGEDLLVGEDGADRVDGGPDRDVLSGGAGADRLDGGDGDDDLGLPVLLTVDRGGPVEVSVETEDDQLFGGGGDDTLFAGPGDRTVDYGLDTEQRAPGRAEANGRDLLSGGDGQDQVSYVNREIPVSASLNGLPDDGAAGEGDDIATDVERVIGGARDDVLSGGPGDQALDGGPGSDTLAGLAGADLLDGGAQDGGADTLAGGAGPDALAGGPGPDDLAGGDDGDVLRGGGGADRLSGDAGDDQLHGDADADELAGGTGADLLDGGPGADRADYSATTTPVTVTLDGLRNDGARGEDWVQQVERVRGGPAADTLVGDDAANVLEGGGGADLLDGGGGEDALAGGAGGDALRARDGARDAVACGTGQDVAVVDERDRLRAGPERCERADAGSGARRGEALLRPAGCRLQVRLPGMARRLPLEAALSVPRSSVIEAGGCAAWLSTRGRAPRARAVGGTIVVRSPGGRLRPLVLELAGGGSSSCRRAPASRPVRRLTVLTRGNVRLQARFATASATGRGAAWTMADRCGSTLTRVRRGSVRVVDRSSARAFTVRAGHRHVSAPRRTRRS
jgi:Ca2+-binding RTX toxin-like protein